jgi:hypothetical protein
MTMLPKLSFAAVAVVSLGAAALAPTEASAWGDYPAWHAGWHGGWYHGVWWGPRFYVGGPVYYGPPVSYGYGTCYVGELLPTPWGPRWRLVNRCY